MHINTRIGSWTIKDGPFRSSESNQIEWLCECDCGILKRVFRSNLVQGASLGCLKCSGSKKVRELKQGDVFGYWTIYMRSSSRKGSVVSYWCRCRCGNEQLIKGIVLRAGRSKWCGKCKYAGK